VRARTPVCAPELFVALLLSVRCRLKHRGHYTTRWEVFCSAVLCALDWEYILQSVNRPFILFNSVYSIMKSSWSVRHQTSNRQLQPAGVSSCSSSRIERLSDARFKDWYDISPFLGLSVCSYVLCKELFDSTVWISQNVNSHHVTVDALTPIDPRQSDASALTAKLLLFSGRVWKTQLSAQIEISCQKPPTLFHCHTAWSTPSRFLMIDDALIAGSRIADPCCG
jgi:hypothetical protein